MWFKCTRPLHSHLLNEVIFSMNGNPKFMLLNYKVWMHNNALLLNCHIMQSTTIVGPFDFSQRCLWSYLQPTPNTFWCPYPHISLIMHVKWCNIFLVTTLPSITCTRSHISLPCNLEQTSILLKRAHWILLPNDLQYSQFLLKTLLFFKL
jgi:hypothetical protein